MSTINTPTPSSNSTFIYKTPCKAFIAGAWGKPGEKPAEKQQDFAGLDDKEANQVAAESLLDLHSEVQVLKVSSKHRINPLVKATLELVVTSVQPDTAVKKVNPKKQKNPNNYYRVVTINGVSPKDISLDEVWQFASQMGVKGQKHKTKKANFDTIATTKDNPPATTEKKSKAEPSLNHVNRKRYFNVLFCDEIQPKLALRGQSLTKEQMTEGLKTDELLHKEIILEYNNKEKHNMIAHKVGCWGAHPSKFAPITWQQSKETLSAVVREYEKCFNNWKLSGNHRGFGENGEEGEGEGEGEPPELKPFSDFTYVNSLLYLHKFVYQFPDVLLKVFGELPKWAFRESIWNSNKDEHKQKPFDQSDWKRRNQSAGYATEAAFKHFNQSNDQKNKIVQYVIF